ARGEGATARAGIETLIALYWKPVYWVIRTHWNQSNEDAKDITQEFFAAFTTRMLPQVREEERPRFRVFVRACLKNFLLSRKRDEGRQKRGGGVATVPIPEDGCDLGLASREATPEQAFDRAWARAVLLESLAS